MPRLRIVLVEPQEGGNVGAVARAMKNFGFRDLLIAGAIPLLHPVAEWWASGAEDIVNSARTTSDLGEALAGAQITIATTSSRERSLSPELNPRHVAELFASMHPEQTMALVFGRENSGLTSRELALCQRTASVPTSPSFPTMNLAQSVAIFCYEAASVSPLRETATRALADADMIERVHERAQRLLLDIGYLHENNPDRIYNDLRAMAGRAHLDHREATILLGILHQLEWKLRDRS
jgi:tRNA/rRNA methyltransferase